MISNEKFPIRRVQGCFVCEIKPPNSNSGIFDCKHLTEKKTKDMQKVLLIILTLTLSKRVTFKL